LVGCQLSEAVQATCHMRACMCSLVGNLEENVAGYLKYKLPLILASIVTIIVQKVSMQMIDKLGLFRTLGSRGSEVC